MRLHVWLLIGCTLAPLAPARAQKAQQTVKPADLVGVWQRYIDDPDRGSRTGHMILRADSLYLKGEFGGDWYGTPWLGQWRLTGDTLWLGHDPVFQKWGGQQWVPPYMVWRDTLQDSLPKLVTMPLIAPPEIGVMAWSKFLGSFGQQGHLSVYRIKLEDKQLSLFTLWNFATPTEEYQKQ